MAPNSSKVLRPYLGRVDVGTEYNGFSVFSKSFPSVDDLLVPEWRVNSLREFSHREICARFCHSCEGSVGVDTVSSDVDEESFVDGFTDWVDVDHFFKDIRKR